MKKTMLMLVVLSLCGCTNISGPGGWKYSSYFFQKQFAELEVTPSTNGGFTLKIKGYQSEAASLVKAASEGVAAGLGRAVVP